MKVGGSRPTRQGFITRCVISLSLREAYFTIVIDVTLSNGQIPPDAKAAGDPNPLPCAAPHDGDNIAEVPVAIGVLVGGGVLFHHQVSIPGVENKVRREKDNLGIINIRRRGETGNSRNEISFETTL